ncbi:response regulator transcription factor [Sagittula salina]|uniref:Response regulator transcription factor n=1 Tax=Sagittula salina TaxID=2820268 RepID=A0A940S3F0_9RHOB|nr:response regulator transcription factor [Sagittula salina]MBP0482690.1 response regulator transcription factor [Sagittula salina]
MRYLIAETNWTMMTLAADLAANGTLMTRTDRPEDIEHFMRHGEADLLVLAADQVGPRGMSLATLRRISTEMPIALVSDRPQPEHIAHWLEAGADCVLDATRPPEEAVVTLQAVARRCLGLSVPQILYGPLKVDLLTRKAHLSGCPLKLSPKLYELLEYLTLRPGQLVTRAELLSHIYGLENEPDARVFDVYICNLRACLQASSGAVDIETVRGSGFRFTAADVAAAVAA